MADLSQVYEALKAADAAGDTQGAQKLADYIKANSAPRSFDMTADGRSVPTGSQEAIAARDPSIGMSGLEKGTAGFGKAFVDLGRGAGQMVGAVNRSDVAESRKLDAPLMASGAAKVGNFAGNLAAVTPAMFIPGVNTAAGATLLGAGQGLLQPSVSTRETLTNTALGGALGYAGNKIGTAISNYATNRAANQAIEQGQNSARDSVLQAAQDVGYKVPPTAVEAGSVKNAVNTGLESVAGKAALRQSMGAANQKVTNNLVREDLGIAADAPLTKDVLGAVRAKAGQIYQAVKDVGVIPKDEQFAQDLGGILQQGADLEKAYPGIGAQAGDKVQALVKALDQPQQTASDAVNVFRYLNEQAKNNFKAAFSEGGNSQALELAKAQSSAADAVGDLIERHLQTSGQQDLYDAWQGARTTIAKSYQAEAALKGSNVNAIALAAQLRKGKPVTGGMGIAANFADHFSEASRVPASGAGVSKLGAAAVGSGIIGGIATGNPALAVGAAALPIASYGTKNALMSRAGQSLLANPSYETPITNWLLTQTGRGGALAAPVGNSLAAANR